MDFTEAVFKACKLITLRNLRTLLYNQGVQVKKDKRVTIVQSLYNILYKKDQAEQTKEEILDQYNTTKELFSCSKLNIIASLIPNPLN